MRYLKLGESEELIKKAFGIKEKEQKKSVRLKRIEKIRKDLENSIKDIMFFNKKIVTA